ncbi:hypothetical protein GCM10010232_44520 [Streptomyces amakusaensis]
MAGRRENPIRTSNRALVTLAQWLRDQRAARGWSYAQLASRAGCHATTLQRAASGRAVPSARSVKEYARACGASVDAAMELWVAARRAERRGVTSGRAPDPQEIEDIDALRAGLLELHASAGRPSMREMERRAGGLGRLPHSTAHRIVLGRTVPRDERQLIGYLTACRTAEAAHQPWITAWRRALGLGTRIPPAPRAAPAPGALPGPRPPAPPAPRTARPVIEAPAPVPAPGPYFMLLGPVRVSFDGHPLPSGSPQQRALLAALLMRGGRTATASELIDGIWGEDPPSQALAALRTYASRLRKIFGPGVLVSESGGYAIRVDAGTLDLNAAEELAMAAEKARAGGDRHRARTLLNESLTLWEGEPLANVPGPYAETQRTRLEEWRLQLTEVRLDLDLEAGCHAEAVSELTALTAAHPLRERLRELLMLALYRSGRQAEALAVYADTRRLLADELGVDPRPELSRLQQRILRADEELARPGEAVRESAPAPVRPAQLPAAVPDFTGRVSSVRELAARLTRAEGDAMAVSALAGIGGIGGVGKTTFAVHVAHAARPHFPDGQLYADLQGTGSRPADPRTVLGAFLRALGTADSAIPETLVERSALYRSVLGGRRVLVLLDNARDAAQVRPLLPGGEGCATLVTSRIRMLDLAGSHLVDLDEMSPQEALQLFTRIVGEERVAPERTAALDVVTACGFLPLAIRIAASRLAARRTWTVSVLAARLADERHRLDELQAGDLAVKATFELGYGQLDEEQKRALRLFGSFAGPFVTLPVMAARLGRGAEATEELLESLVDTGLLMSMGPGCYQMHNLARLFAQSRAELDEPPPPGPA